MSRFGPERRIPTDLDHRFLWRSRDGYPDAAPTLSVEWPTQTRTYAMTALRAPDVIVSVSDGGREITIECASQPGADLRGLIEELGGYIHIDGGASYQGPNRVMELVSQTDPVDGVVTAVLRLAAPIRGGARPVPSYSGATGLLARSLQPFVAGPAFTLYGTAFTYANRGGAGNLGTVIDIGGAPDDYEMATRVAAAINDAGIGVTATGGEEIDVGLVGLGEEAITGLPGSSPYTASGMSGGTNVGAWRARWTTYGATLLAAHAGTARLRNVRWSLSWLRRTGADAPTLQRRDQGFLHVSVAPFDTGLEDADLYQLVPNWAAMVPESQGSWAPQRWLAEDELIARLRPRLGTGKCEDDVLGEQFRRCHALFTAAVIRRGHALLGYEGAAESAEALHALALEALELALGCLTWLDADGNGVVGSTETGVDKASVTGLLTATYFDQDPDEVEPGRSYWWEIR